MSVTIRLINNNRWAGVIKYPERHTDICPYIRKNGDLYTSFDESDPEDRKELAKFEKMLHTELHCKSLFWETYFVRLTADDLILHPGEYDGDALKLRFLKKHKDAQLSPRKPKANALFMIVDEEEEAKAINDRSRVKTLAFSEYNKMTVDEKRDCLMLYGQNYLTGSNEIVEARLFELMDESPTKFVRLWVDDKLKHTKVLIQKAVSKGVISRKGKSFFYGSIPLGSTVDEAAVELDKGENAQLKAGVKKGLEEGNGK